MHAVARGGWLGQTYALAKFDDSFEGKKSGVRRSKEERKGMVETFIKRYQKSNNGDFPSLNLTRKEVGGSFYTVREIVREIIQENRVLGPPKSPPGDQNMENLDSFLEDHPLGSIAVDHVHSVLPIDTQSLHEYEFISEKALTTRSSSELHQGHLGHDNVVDGIMNTTEKDVEAKDPGSTDLLVGKDVEKHADYEDKNYVEISQLSGGDMVETTHATVYNEALEKPNKTELVTEGGMGEQKEEKKVVANQTQKHRILEDIEVGTLVASTVHNMDEKSSERELVDGEKDTLLAVNGNTNAILEDTLLAEEKTVICDNAQNLYSKATCNPVQQPTLDERSVDVNKSSDQTEGSSQKRKNNTTLNRINLESWKAASKKSYGREPHQLVMFIKSFITAFVKFWTE